MYLLQKAKNCITLLYTCLMGITVFLLIFLEKGTAYYLKKDIGVSNPLLLAAGLFITFILTGIIVFINCKFHIIFFERPEKSRVILTITVLSLVLFISEIIYSASAFFYSDWDPAGVLDCVYKIHRGMKEEVSIDYMSAHPNNLMLVLIYLMVLRIGTFFGTESIICISVFQSLIFTLSGVLFFFIVRDLFSFRTAVYSWIFYALWTGFAPYLIITYSDAVGIIFPLITVRLFQLYYNKRAYILPLLSGISAAIGYAVKPQTFIVFTAVLLILLFCAVSLKDIVPLKQAVFSLITFIIMMLIINRLFFPSLGLDLDKSKSFGMTHYLMMGLNPETDGVYSNDDTEFTNSIPDPETRRLENLRVTAERLRAYGFKGFMGHLMRKQLINFSDGTFSWGIDGNFFAGTKMSDFPEVSEDSPLRPLILSFITPEGSRYPLFLKTTQMIWLTVLFLSFLSGIICIISSARPFDKDCSPVMCLIMLSLTGLIIFELLFEAKARYLFTFLPLFIIPAIQTVRKLENYLPQGRFSSQGK